MAGLAFLIAFIVTFVFFVLDLMPLNADKERGTGSYVSTSFFTAVGLLIVLFSVNFLILFFGLPAFTGQFGGVTWVWLDVLIAALFLWGKGVATNTFSAGSLVVGGVLVLWSVAIVVQAIIWPHSNAEARHLVGLVNIEEQPAGLYPETDADHILLVPEEAALFKARQIISKASDTEGRNLSTIYTPDYPALQSINQHLYWVFQLKLVGWRVANQVNRIVPGYIVVDAEDPSAEPMVKLGYKMQYTLGAPTRNSLERYIYSHGYRDYMIDDLTIEIRDDWQPFYSASLNRPALRYVGSVPEKMILVNPENGDIQMYSLGEIPEWVDRVYSKQVAHDFMEWWGHWSKAEWKFIGESPANRTQPAGKPHLVYTKGGHPMWQILMTSWNQDTSVVYVVLFDGRSRTAKVYDVRGIAIEEAVLKSFRTTNKNLKNFEPVHPSIHKIYGKLTWVVSYISIDANTDGAEPFQGVGLLAADNVEGANVVMASSKDRAFTEYRQLLARGNANEAPGENSLTKVARGKVVNVVLAVVEGNTNYYLTLDSDDTHVFQGRIGDNLELPFVATGKEVQITYLDIGKARVDIISYDDLSMAIDNGGGGQ